MVLIIEREADARGLHLLWPTVGLSLCWMAQPRIHLRFFRGWADAGAELRLGRILLALSWDYEPPAAIAREIQGLWTEQQEAAYRRGAEEREKGS